MTHKVVIYDNEVYPNIFTIAGQDLVTGETFIFEISWRLDQRYELMEFLRRLKMNGYSMVGFNNEAYDYPVLHFIIENIDHVTVEQIYEKSMQIINTPFMNRFAHIVWDRDRHIPQIDLYKIYHFDNVSRATSLKVLEFNMRMDNVEDLPFPPGTFLLDEQMDTLITYNHHDVKATTKFHGFSEKQLAFRRELSEKYDRNMMNFNDTKIGKEYFIMELERLVPGFNKKQKTKRDQIKVSDVLFPYIAFHEPEFQRIHNWFHDQVISPKKKGEDVELKGFFKNVNCVVRGFQFDFGAGGLHGSIDSRIVEADNENMILDLDVSSYYPNLAITNKLYPEHLGESFCDIYKSVYEQRKTYAKGTTENAMMKLALLGVYGDSNNKYSTFLDPQYTVAITINGQLLLCMLAEALMVNHQVQIIQANTDGITIKLPRLHEKWVKNVMTWWEDLTNLELEAVEYSRMFIRDVNSYIGEYTSGELKRIGAYCHVRAEHDSGTRELGWHKNHSALVVPKAAEAALIHGTDIREFVENHKNQHDFLLRTKVPRSSELIGVDYEGNETKHQNVSRYYISMFGEAFIKRMPPTPGQVQKDPAAPKRNIGINAGWRVSVANNISDVFPDDIEYAWYIKEAEKLVNPILNGGVL